jgi:hypothetical protein
VSDGIRTRDRRDHNPAKSVPVRGGADAFELGEDQRPTSDASRPFAADERSAVVVGYCIARDLVGPGADRGRALEFAGPAVDPQHHL